MASEEADAVQSGDKMTNWPNVEERIRPILDVLVEEAGFQPPAGSQLRQSWISGAREYAEVVGVDGELVRRTIRHMRNEGLVIKSPRSLIAVALTFKHEPRREFKQGGFAGE